MKNKLLILLCIIMIGSVGAWSEDEFNNSLTTEGITFAEDENFTRWLSVPENTVITNATMSFFSDYYWIELPFNSNVDIMNGLPLGYDAEPKPDVFYKNETTYLIIGGYSGLFAGYNWTGSAWQSDSNIISGLIDTGFYSSPTVFEKDSVWYLITSSHNNEYEGYNWTGSAWQSDSNIISGLGNTFYNHETPEVFYKDSQLYLVTGTTGSFEGYNWTGSAWQSDSNIISGLISRNYNDLVIFERNSIWYAINGRASSSFEGYNWTGSAWQSDVRFLEKLDEITGYTLSPTVFNFSEDFYLITGTQIGGTLKGASLDVCENSSLFIDNTQVWSYYGKLNISNQTSNFAQTINNYIETATAVAGYYLIPFIFHSDTAGILEYLSLIFNNDGFYENSQTYENSTFSGGVETFQLNITYDNNRYSNSQAYFYYNGDSYLATKTGSGSSLSFSKTLNIPILTAETNRTFYWQVELYDGTWEYYNSTFHNQTIYPVYFGVCGGVSNDTLINMSLLDENTQTSITGDIQIRADVISKSSGEIVESLNTSFEDIQHGAICLSPVSSYNLYYLDMEIRYNSNGFVPELYHIQKAELANATNLSLYDLNESSSTEFKVVYQDNTFSFIEGAIIQLQRKYISEGVYKIVEASLTSNEGIAILHIDLDSIKYRATVVKDGVVLDEFDNLVFKCQSELTGECEQKLLGAIDPSNDINIDTTKDFVYSLNKAGNVITLSFSIPSGLPSSVNMQMIQKDQFGNNEMCNTTIVSSAGSIQCSYNDTIGDSYIDLNIYKNTEPMATTSYIIPEDSGMDFLGNNYIIIVVLLLSIVGMALTSPEWIIINGIIVMVISGALWLVNGLDFVIGLGNLMWLIIAAGILIFKLAKQEDR